MKKIILAILILGIMATSAFAIETTLDEPMVIITPAKIVAQYSFTVVPTTNEVRVLMKFKDVNGNPIEYQKECEFVDPAITNAVITSNKVGQKYINVMAQFFQTKCKGLWNITGTDN